MMDGNVIDNEQSGILDDLDDLDKAIIRFKVDGLKNTDIAKKTGKHINTITIRLKKIKTQQAIEELQKKAVEILVDSQAEAGRVLRSIMRNPDERSQDRIAACREILKGVLSENINLNINAMKKIKDYLDEDDLEHIIEEEENE